MLSAGLMLQTCSANSPTSNLVLLVLMSRSSATFFASSGYIAFTGSCNSLRVRAVTEHTIMSRWRMSSPMEVCKSDMISCAVEWQPSEAASAFDVPVWPLMTRRTERASQGKRPYSVPEMPDQDEMVLSYTLMGLSARSKLRSY
jgi:hypothetical protein